MGLASNIYNITNNWHLLQTDNKSKICYRFVEMLEDLSQITNRRFVVPDWRYGVTDIMTPPKVVSKRDVSKAFVNPKKLPNIP